MFKVNIASNWICQPPVPPDKVHQKEHITSVVFLPKIHKPDCIVGNMRQTQVEGQSAKLASAFQKCQDCERQIKRDCPRL